MQVEINDMYQNVPVKATLESGVTLIDGKSAVGKSFFFEVLKCLAIKHGYSCVHITAMDGLIMGYLQESDVKRKQKHFDAIIALMISMDIVAISNADIFVSREMLRTVLAQNPDIIILLETKETPSYGFLRPTPIYIKQITSKQASLVLSEGVAV